MAKYLESSVKLGFKWMEKHEIEREEQGEQCHHQNLNKRRQQEHIHYKDEPMQEEERVKETICEAGLAVHCFIKHIELGVFLQNKESSKRLDNNPENQEGKQEIQESQAQS